MVDLDAKIIDTWNEKVEATYEAEGLPHEVWWADRAVGDDLAFELALERERTEHRLVPDNPHARAGTAAQREWEEMTRAYRAYRAYRRERERDLTLPTFLRYERAQIAYWRAYTTALSREDPAVRDIAHEVRSRMEGFYERTAEFEEVWRNAGRPRAAI